VQGEIAVDGELAPDGGRDAFVDPGLARFQSKVRMKMTAAAIRMSRLASSQSRILVRRDIASASPMEGYQHAPTPADSGFPARQSPWRLWIDQTGKAVCCQRRISASC
jgi:hypothetical protein